MNDLLRIIAEAIFCFTWRRICINMSASITIVGQLTPSNNDSILFYSILFYFKICLDFIRELVHFLGRAIELARVMMFNRYLISCV
jgi:hypothetical protein